MTLAESTDWTRARIDVLRGPNDLTPRFIAMLHVDLTIRDSIGRVPAVSHGRTASEALRHPATLLEGEVEGRVSPTTAAPDSAPEEDAHVQAA